jgi:phosphatidylserine/phosphatidylglycerophosphate/cardiolipin synthase-like enzyme
MSVKILSKAKSEILLQVYSFTIAKIAKALIDAHKRNVPIEIVLDKSNVSAKYCLANLSYTLNL